MYPGRIGGASNRVGGGFGDDDLLSNRNGSHSGLGSRTVSDDAQRAIPGIFMSMDCQQRPAREQEDRQQEREPPAWTGRALHLAFESSIGSRAGATLQTLLCIAKWFANVYHARKASGFAMVV